MTCIQLDLFEDKTDKILMLRKEMEEVKKQAHNVRRGVFSRLSSLEKLVIHLQQEIEQKDAIIESKR